MENSGNGGLEDDYKSQLIAHLMELLRSELEQHDLLQEFVPTCDDPVTENILNDGSSLHKDTLFQETDETGTPEASSVLGVGSESTCFATDERPGSRGRPVEVHSDSGFESCNEQEYSRHPEQTLSSDQLQTTAHLKPTPKIFNDPTALETVNSIRERELQFLNERICRICHESDQVEELLSPCKCRGTLSLVHRSCLQHWLAESDSSSCELCRFKYQTKRSPKYTLPASLVAWFKQNRRQRRALIVDTLSLLAFVPFATVVTYIAAQLVDGVEYQESPSYMDMTIRFAIVSLISMMTTIDVAFATWGILKMQHHISNWYNWYRRNSVVTLMINNSHNH